MGTGESADVESGDGGATGGFSGEQSRPRGREGQPRWRESMPPRVRWVPRNCRVHLLRCGCGGRGEASSPGCPGLSRGLAGPVGQPSPLVQRLPFQPRSALAPPARPRGVQRGLGLRRDAAHLGSDFSQNRERNPNRPSSLSPRVCKGGGTLSSQRW